MFLQKVHYTFSLKKKKSSNPKDATSLQISKRGVQGPVLQSRPLPVFRVLDQVASGVLSNQGSNVPSGWVSLPISKSHVQIIPGIQHPALHVHVAWFSRSFTDRWLTPPIQSCVISCQLRYGRHSFSRLSLNQCFLPKMLNSSCHVDARHPSGHLYCKLHPGSSTFIYLQPHISPNLPSPLMWNSSSKIT